MWMRSRRILLNPPKSGLACCMLACDAPMLSTTMATLFGCSLGFLDTKTLMCWRWCGTPQGRDTVLMLYLGECGECLNYSLGKTNLSHLHGPFDLLALPLLH